MFRLHASSHGSYNAKHFNRTQYDDVAFERANNTETAKDGFMKGARLEQALRVSVANRRPYGFVEFSTSKSILNSKNNVVQSTIATAEIPCPLSGNHSFGK